MCFSYALLLLFIIPFSIVFVEGTTELLCKSLIFTSFRKWASKKHPFLKDLIGCGYCTSVWVAIAPAIYLSFVVLPGELSFPLFIPAVVFYHRMSNYLHNFCDKHLDKFYDARFKGSIVKEDEDITNG